MTNKRIAFTLIELLVVIAIIGILSGLIVVTINGVTQKANIAKAQVFSNSLRNALMLNLVSEWKFDGSGVADGGNATTSYTQDSWGTNNGTIGGTPLVYSGSSCVYSSCLSFGGSSDYLNCGNSTSFNITDNITVEMWIKPAIDNKYLIDKTSAYSFILETNYYPTASLMASKIESNVAVPQNQWSQIAFSRDAVNGILVYINGVKVATTVVYGSQNPSGSITVNANNFYVGEYGGGTYRFSGLIDNVRLYSAAIPVSQIKEQYYAGLNSLLINGGITKEEYLSRLNNYAFSN